MTNTNIWPSATQRLSEDEWSLCVRQDFATVPQGSVGTACKNCFQSCFVDKKRVTAAVRQSNKTNTTWSTNRKGLKTTTEIEACCKQRAVGLICTGYSVYIITWRWQCHFVPIDSCPFTSTDTSHSFMQRLLLRYDMIETWPRRWLC